MTDKKMNDGKLRFYDKGKETFAIGDPYWGKCQTPKTKLHIEQTAKREAENKALEALGIDYEDFGQKP